MTPLRAYALACLPPLVALWFIYVYGINTFIADDIEFAQRFEQFARGNLSYSLFMQPHNLHPVLISLLAMILIGSRTSHSSIALMYTSWFLLLCSLGIIIQVLKKGQVSNAKLLLGATAASASLFSLRDSETFLFGSLICSAMTFFFSIVCFYYLAILKDQNDRRSLYLAIASAVGSTFGGFAGGVFCWPIGLAIIACKAYLQAQEQKLTSRFKKWKLPILSWLIATAGSACVLTVSAVSSTPVQSLASGITTSLSSWLFHAGNFLLTLLGFPIFSSNFLFFGSIHLLLLAIASVLFISNLRHESRISVQRTNSETSTNLLLFGFACMAFGLLISLLITGTRYQPSDPTYIVATAPRYALWTSLSLLGCFLIGMGDITSKNGLRNSVLAISMACISLGYLCGLEKSTLQGKFTKIQLSLNKYFLLTYKQQPSETLLKVHPNLGKFLISARDIEKRRWNVFSQISPDLKTLPQCTTQKFLIKFVAPDRKEGNTRVINRSESPMFVVSGWAIDKSTGKPSSDICLNIGDQYVMKGVCEQPSDELATYFGSKKLMTSSFLITFATKDLQPGIYPVSLTIANSARTEAMTTEALFLLRVE